MGASKDILDALKDDLQSYLTSNGTGEYVVECVDKRDLDLLSDSDKKRFPDFKVGLYEVSPSELTKVSSSKVIDWNQAYEIKIFGALSKDGQYDEQAEYRLMDTKDLIKDWMDGDSGINLNTATSGKLLSLQFDSQDTPIREVRYMSMRMRMAGFRNDL